MIHREVVERRLREIERAVAELRKHSARTLEELRGDLGLQWLVEHGLLVAVQSVLDVSSHLLASGGLNEVEDYADALEKLGRHGIVPEEFAARIRAMAGFRNVLVHEYLEVDLARVHRVLTERLGDFEEFARHVERHLDASDDPADGAGDAAADP